MLKKSRHMKLGHLACPARHSSCLAVFACWHARQRFSRFASVCFLPVACLVFACIAFVASSVAASACGISWSLPPTPMDSEYRFQYWEELDRVAVEKSHLPGATKIPLHFGFNPSATFPSLLGVGWSLPIFESRAEWRGADSVELFLPDGQTEILERTNGNNKRLRGSGWIAEISGRQMTCKASCGWVLVFFDNRLSSMRTPNGTQMDFAIAPDRSRSWSANGQTFVSLKPDFDKKTTQKIYLLKYDSETVLFRMGKRPIIVKGKEIRDGKRAPDKTVHGESLVAIEFNGKMRKNKNYDFQKDGLRTVENSFRWNPENRDILKVGDVSYSKVTIEGVRCLKKIDGKGRIEIGGTYVGRLMSVYKSFEEEDIRVQEFIHMPKRGLLEVPRRLFKIKPNGEKHLIRQYWYNEDGETIRAYINEDDKKDGRYVVRTDDAIKILDSKKQTLLFAKYNSSGKISTIEANGKKIRIEYSGSNARLVVDDNGATYEKLLTTIELESLLKKTFPLLHK